MPSPSCYGSARISRVRISELDPDTLAPLAGSDNGLVIDHQILLSFDPVLRTGEEIEQTNGDGELCISLQEDDQLKRWTVRLQVCRIHPVLDAKLTGASLITDSGSPVGMQAPSAGVALSNPVCLEAWTRAIEVTAQAVAPVTSPDLSYWHFVFPYLHGCVPGSTELNSGAHLFEYNGRADENSAITANGPFNDWPDYVADAGGITKGYGKFLDGPPPDSACAPIVVPSGS